ncbi:unnamed protein product [Orchesella dallaii]|uniref:G-protein coupled receptors family 1 profile domain-containing protein n=1 Tax=Orchesella dallaii TaxID=48710 RepID=A0ABP1R4S8_9HEXA
MFVSTLQPIRNSGRYKCREIWPSEESEKIFNLVLDFLLLLIPLCIMAMAYSLIVSKLWKGLQSEIRHTRSFRQHGPHGHLIPRDDSLELSTHSHYSPCKLGNTENVTATGSRMCTTSQSREGVSNEIVTLKGGRGVVVRWRRKHPIEEVTEVTTSTSTRGVAYGRGASNSDHHHCHLNNHATNVLKQNGHSVRQKPSHNHHLQPHPPPTHQASNVARAIRSTYTGKSMESKKKVIRMLFVLVAEFFVCWTPLYVMNTWYLFDSEAVYNHIGPFGVVLIQLLAYVSSCCNPITYCFMNRKFRQAFIKVFQCCTSRAVAKTGPPTLGRGSDMSANDSLIYGVPASTMNKSG